MALDSLLDDEPKDPEGTNSARAVQGAQSANKPREFAKGALSTNYFAEAADEEGELSAEQIDALCEHCEENLGFSPEMLKALRGRLGAKQAQDDDDEPPAFRGQPLRGGAMRAMDAAAAARMAMDVKAKMGRMSRPERDQFIRKNPKLVSSLRAYDSAAKKSFSKRWPEVARITGNGMTNKRDAVPPQLALDTGKRRGGAKSFAERHPDAARIRFSY